MAKKLVIVESPAKAKTIAGYLGAGYDVESSIGHIRDLPNRASDVPKEKRAKYGTMGVAIDVRLRAALHRRRRQEGEGQRAEEEAQGRRRAPARDGRGPRGRGDRLAPAAGAEAKGAGAPDGLPRDHAGRDPARAGRDTRRRPAARRRSGDPPHPRPALRLRGLAGALEEGHAGPLRRPRPVGRRPARRRARARATRLRQRRLLGHQRQLRSRLLRGTPRRPRRQARRPGPRLHPAGRAQVERPGPARRGCGARARGGAGGPHVRGPLCGREAVHAPARPRRS